MQCLIDGDVLCYEIGFAAEASWKYSYPDVDLGSDPPPWEKAHELLTLRIQHIEDACEATEPSILFFTGPSNFRTQIAKRTPYKNRNGPKPYHYHNIKAYLKSEYAFQQRDGLEADDLMAIYQTDRICHRDTIICTRDKDLDAVAGWRYGWELGAQPSFGPFFISGYGSLGLSPDRKKLKGYGNKFFLSQCITGDVVDTIPGLRGYGPSKAFDILEATTTYAEGLQAVREAYKAAGEDDEYLLEQGQLLWMLRKPDEMWTLEYEE